MKKILSTIFALHLLSGLAIADTAITELDSINILVDTDLLETVDVSDTSMATSGTNKKATLAVLSNYLKTALQDTFYTESEIDAAFQPLDSLLTDISNLTDPDEDILLFWDDSAGDIVWLTVGNNLTITDTTIDATNTDNQTIDVFSLGGTTLSLSLERDGVPNETVDLASLQDGTGTDDQQIDVFNLDGTNLELSIEDDGQATQIVDLSSLQDGTGTDDQDASEVSILDSGGYYTSTDVEGALAEIAGGGASQLSELSDVNSSTPTNRNVLVADGVDFESRALTEADISDLGTYIGASDVTFENLDSNGDVGTGASQVAQGDHAHAGVYEPVDATILREADVDDTPVDGVTSAPVSSNWAYDHEQASDPHTGYALESSLGSAASRDAEDILTNGSNLPDGAAIITYGSANWDDPGTDDQDASEVDTIITNFDNHLSASDDTVQKALETLDEIAAGGANQLSDLSDVNSSTATNRNVLVADGTDFESRALTEADISDLGTYIESSDVTFETLDSNGDVGTSANQLAEGNHTHTGVYEPADSTIVKDGDFTSDGFLIRSGGSGSYSVDTNTYSLSSHNHSGVYEPVDATILRQSDVDDTPVDGVTSAPVSSNWAYDHADNHAPSNADNTALNETSHADVVVDGDFTSDGILTRSGGLGSYSVDTSTYIEASGVTFENLDNNGDVGNGAAQVAQGNHDHSGVYEPVDGNITRDDENETITGNWTYSGDIVLNEKSDHSSTPGAGKGYIWLRDDAPSALIFTDDLGTDHDLTASAPSSLSDLSDVNTANPSNRNVLIADGVDFESRQIVEADISDLQSYLTSEVNDLSSVVTWANVPNANITESSVTQHEAALSITESQISDLQSYLTAETNDLSSVVTWDNVPDANITESSVTQHEAALSITESQISDLGSYIESSDVTYENLNTNGDVGSGVGQVADGQHNHSGVYEPVFSKNTAFNKDFGTSSGTVAEGDHDHSGTYEPADSTIVKDGDFTSDGFLKRSGGSGSYTVDTNTYSVDGHSHTEADITDLGSYIESSGVTYENLNANGDVGTGSNQVAQGDHTHSYLSNISEDSSPTLGGDLDIVNYEIASSTGTGNVVIELGDAAGTNFFELEDSTDASIFSINSDGDVTLIEKADHSVTPAAGYGYLWVKSDTPSSLIYTDDAGTDYDLTDVSGSGGGMSWQVVSSNTTATADNGYMVDSSAGTVTITLPASPSEGDRVGILDNEGTFGTNAVTVGRNGNNIMGLAENLLLNSNNQSVVLVYGNATHGWRIETTTPISTDVNLALGDLTDVGDTTYTNRNALMADGDSWESRALVEADISDLGTYLENISEDTTPELGGDLNVGSNEIQSTGNVVVQLGDDAGSNVFEVENSSSDELFWVGSDGTTTIAFNSSTGADWFNVINSAATEILNISSAGDMDFQGTTFRLSDGNGTISIDNNNEIQSSDDIVLQLGDNIGSDVFEIEDSLGGTVFSVDSDGDIDEVGDIYQPSGKSIYEDVGGGADAMFSLSVGNVYFKLGDTSGSKDLSIDDSDYNEVFSVNSDGVVATTEIDNSAGINADSYIDMRGGSGTLLMDSNNAIQAGSGQNITVQLGDNAGSNVLEIEDSNNSTVFTVDSHGDIDIVGNTFIPAGKGIYEDTGATSDAGFSLQGGNSYFVLGDAAGSTSLAIYDSDSSVVFSVDSDGDLSTDGNITSTDTTDTSLSSFGSEPLSLGSSSSYNMGIDTNEIQARNNGSASSLYINDGGGDIRFGGDLITSGNKIEAGTANDIIIKSGDSSGSNKVSFEDNTSDEVASIDSDGNAYFSGTLQGYTNVTDKTISATLTDSEMNGIVFVDPSGTTTITLPPVEEGQTVCVYAEDTNTIHVDPNASDRIVLEGTALDDGDKLTDDDTAGSFVCLIGDSADGWTTLGISGTWTDGG